MINKPVSCPWCNSEIDDPYEEMQKNYGTAVEPHVVTCYCKWGHKVVGFSVGFNIDCKVEWFVIQKVVSESSFISIRIEINPPRCIVVLHGERVSKNSTAIALEETSKIPHLTISEAKNKLLKYEKLLVFA